jgi:hypothetical protein
VIFIPLTVVRVWVTVVVKEPFLGCRSKRAVWKVRGLTLLLRVGNLWRCGDCLFFKVPPLSSDALYYNAPPTSRERKRSNKWVHELLKRPSWLLRHSKKGYIKTTVTQILTTVTGMQITPLLRYPTTTTWHNSHRLPLHNSGALPPVHEVFKRPSHVEVLQIMKFLIMESFIASHISLSLRIKCSRYCVYLRKKKCLWLFSTAVEIVSAIENFFTSGHQDQRDKRNQI